MPVKIFNAINEIIEEKSEATYRCRFRESPTAADPLIGAAIQSITASLHDSTSNNVINARNAQNVLNANGGTLASDGWFNLILGTDDTPLVNAAATDLEEHKLTLVVTFFRTGGGLGTIRHEIRHYIQPLEHVA